MAPSRTLYAISAFVWDDDEHKEGLREPEVYDDKDAANKAGKNLLRRLSDFIDPDGSRDEWEYEDTLDDEGLYRGEHQCGQCAANE